jgi:hypothetical protein
METFKKWWTQFAAVLAGMFGEWYFEVASKVQEILEIVL